MTAINLNKEVPCEHICHHVQLLINNFRRDNPDIRECTLVLEIKPITDSQIIEHKPLLEHKT